MINISDYILNSYQIDNQSQLVIRNYEFNNFTSYNNSHHALTSDSLPELIPVVLMRAYDQ